MLTIESVGALGRLRREGLGQEHRRGQVNGQRAFECAAIERGDLVFVELAGIVDQECERPERRRRWYQSAQSLGIGKIGEYHARFAAGAHDLAGKFLGFGARTMRVQHHRVAGARQRKRNRPADAAPRPGDQRRARLCLVVRHPASSLPPVIRQSIRRCYRAHGGVLFHAPSCTW